jgi:hypothetical protein
MVSESKLLGFTTKKTFSGPPPAAAGVAVADKVKIAKKRASCVFMGSFGILIFPGKIERGGLIPLKLRL